tara:strand:+ start:2451 stop:5114 length:2664 start_codon:yes stop_codon:yes gene_type:complete
MLIKSKNKKNKVYLIFLKYISKKSSKFILFFSFISIYTGLILAISSPKLRNSIKDSLPSEIKYELKKFRYAKNPISWIKGISTPVEKIFIDIKFKNYQKLERKRSEALKTGILITNQDDFVNATLRKSDKTLKAKIRLKGDFTDHLQHKKWSFRVKIRDGLTLNNMNKFSLHDPVTRNYLWEWVYHKLLKEEGVPSLNYSFVDLTVNGESLGIYAIEEHFDKILIESNLFREGPIVSLSENYMWEDRAKSQKEKIPQRLTNNEYYYNSEPKVFKESKTIKNQILKKQFLKASQLLNGFYEGKLKTSDVFSIEHLAKYFAITDLINSWHGTNWHNQRFYYDPIMSKLIPIGFDGMGGKYEGAFGYEEVPNSLSIDRFLSGRMKELPFFDDPIFIEAYVSNLERISKKEYLDNFFYKVNEEFINSANKLKKSYPQISEDNLRKRIYEFQRIIDSHLNPLPELLNIYVQSYSASQIDFAIGNKHFLPIKLLEVYSNNEFIGNISKDSYIKPKKRFDLIEYNNFSIKNKFASLKNTEEFFSDTNKNLKIKYKILGSSKVREQIIKSYPRLNSELVQNDLIRKKSNIDKFNFIKVDKENKNIYFEKGNLLINEPLIIPENHKVIVGKGTIITLEENGLIFSKSPIELSGTKLEPIKIIAENSGQGLVVINAYKKSLIENVIFDNLSTPNFENWTVPGAVTFYYSPVEILNSTFKDNQSEDGLNIVKSTFSIKNTKFIRTFSDALDIDFSDGTIENMIIYKPGNDGLDISGSKVSLTNMNVEAAGDKAISIGEASELNAFDSRVKDSFIALASKDSSKVNINNLFIESTDIGFTLFKKKNEYSIPSQINIKNLNYKNVNELYLSSNDSKLIIDNISFENNSTNEYINGLVYGK